MIDVVTTSDHRLDEQVITRMRTRATRATDDLEEKREAVELALEARDELIVEFCEAGVKTREVARWFRIKQPTVVHILAKN